MTRRNFSKVPIDPFTNRPFEEEQLAIGPYAMGQPRGSIGRQPSHRIRAR